MKQTDKQTTVRLYVAYTMTLKNIPKPTHSVNFLVLFKQKKKQQKILFVVTSNRLRLCNNSNKTKTATTTVYINTT